MGLLAGCRGRSRRYPSPSRAQVIFSSPEISFGGRSVRTLLRDLVACDGGRRPGHGGLGCSLDSRQSRRRKRASARHALPGDQRRANASPHSRIDECQTGQEGHQSIPTQGGGRRQRTCRSRSERLRRSRRETGCSRGTGLQVEIHVLHVPAALAASFQLPLRQARPREI